VNIGKMRHEKIDDEIGRITKYEEWLNLVEYPDSEDGAVRRCSSNEARETITVRPPLPVA
jgi:hypothetical protein